MRYNLLFILLWSCFLPLHSVQADAELANRNLNLPNDIQKKMQSPVLYTSDYYSAEKLEESINIKAAEIINASQAKLKLLNNNNLSGNNSKSNCSVGESVPDKNSKASIIVPSNNDINIQKEYQCIDNTKLPVTDDINSIRSQTKIPQPSGPENKTDAVLYVILGHENDNWKDIKNLHSKDVTKRKQKTDDLGRTQGFSGEIGVIKETDQYSAKCEVIGFGKPVIIDNSKKDPHGRPYLQMVQLSNCKADALVGSNPELQLATSIEYENIKGKNTTSNKIQDYWHSRNQYVRYHYVDSDEDQKSVRAKIGLQSKQEFNLKNIQCRVIAKSLLGIDDKGQPLSDAKFTAGIENSFIGLETWLSRQDLPKDRRTDRSIQLFSKSKVSVNGTKMMVEPFVTWSKYSSKLDEYSRQKNDGDYLSNETVMKVGFKIFWQP